MTYAGNFIYKQDYFYEPILLLKDLSDKERYDKYLNSEKNSPKDFIFQKMNNEYMKNYFKSQIDYSDWDFDILLSFGNFGKPQKYYVNSYNKIAYAITEKNFILPFTEVINLEDHKNKLVYDGEFILKAPSFDKYIEQLNLANKSIINNNQLPIDQQIIGVIEK